MSNVCYINRLQIMVKCKVFVLVFLRREKWQVVTTEIQSWIYQLWAYVLFSLFQTVGRFKGNFFKHFKFNR